MKTDCQRARTPRLPNPMNRRRYRMNGTDEERQGHVLLRIMTT